VFAFACGHIRIFHAIKNYLMVEIAAHSRWINAIQIHPDKPILACCAEDTHVTVWTLPTDKHPQVSSLLVQSPAPALLTGLRFASGDTIAVTAYDSRFVFSLPTP